MHSGCADCLDYLLTSDSDQSEPVSKVRQEVSKMVDKDGWTIAHLAAIRESQVSPKQSNPFIALFGVHKTQLPCR